MGRGRAVLLAAEMVWTVGADGVEDRDRTVGIACLSGGSAVEGNKLDGAAVAGPPVWSDDFARLHHGGAEPRADVSVFRGDAAVPRVDDARASLARGCDRAADVDLG